ncbi:helix-turn-helix transcriptional regulator [Romboutsia timonensis]|uniref:helix-turn-helix domain-containing protein n=1 Tax=Romboutsia timonensis TaxID=1776391 RepID=UPI002A763AC8|nr:helix-turn-helix transcriptional regulator [Romboutsia timonensis]MDY3001910.1 helix-turn-helix transcriptional regulator [Romboutsia timonensis]MDY3960715.1 helix-turn-helix transcriptional regulator [Romboutsia timonensis]
MNIGENIKTYRKEKGLTQEQLGNLSGLSKNAIYNYENNKRVPNIDTIKQIANALDIPISILTGERDAIDLFATAGGLEDNSKVEALMSKLNITKLTPDNINSIRYTLEKDKVNLAIALLENHRYKATILGNEFVTISDYDNILKPFNIDLDTFIDFSKNLHWAIDSFINKFIDENSNENNTEYVPEYQYLQFIDKVNNMTSINLDESEKNLIDKFGIPKGMHKKKNNPSKKESE